jgi:hypothetical protein
MYVNESHSFYENFFRLALVAFKRRLRVKIVRPVPILFVEIVWQFSGLSVILIVIIILKVNKPLFDFGDIDHANFTNVCFGGCFSSFCWMFHWRG